MILMLCLLGVASALVVPAPYINPYAFPNYQPAVIPTFYSVAPKAVIAPIVQPGYIAKTPGAEHYAPLPEGLAYASHHINLKPAPGTE